MAFPRRNRGRLRQGRAVTSAVTEDCIACKHMDCVDVCPVDCFYEGENMLVIGPDECIDCGVREPECPIDAIKPEIDPGGKPWVELNRKYARLWPSIVEKGMAPDNAKAMEGVPNKLRELFSEQPGEGS